MRIFLLVCVMTLAAAAAGAQAPRREPLLGVGSDPVQPPAPVAANASAPFFDDTVLQEVRLDINSKDWETLKENFLSNAYYPADLRWRGETVRNVGIRSRGNASRSGTKPGLRVDFNRYSANQTFLGLKSFVLRNNTTDATSLRERVSMLVFRRMGVPAPREAHARLYVNSSYAGLYSMVESVDKTFLANVYGEGGQDGYLYGFERNLGDVPYHFEYSGPEPERYVPHPFKPETHESDSRPERIVEMVRTVAEASQAIFRSAIAGLVDVEQWVRYVAVEMFLGDNDGFLGGSGMNNFYLYRPHVEARHVLIPWDKSEATLNGSGYSVLHTLRSVPESERNRLMVRLMASEDLRSLYFDTLVACAAMAMEPATEDGRGWLEREVDRELQQIRDALHEDPAKPFTDVQIAEAAEALVKFAQDRPGFVINEVDSLRD